MWAYSPKNREKW